MVNIKDLFKANLAFLSRILNYAVRGASLSSKHGSE